MHVRDRIEVTIHVWPSVVLCHLVDEVLVSVGTSHLVLLGLKVDLIIQEVLIIGQILNRPLILFRVLVFNFSFFGFYLHVPFVIDAFDLAWSESLEVIGHISVRSELRGSSCEVFSHDVTHIGSGDFMLVFDFLFDFPLVFSFLLLLGQALVVSLHLFKLLGLFDSHVVFEHSSHAGHVFGLRSVLALFNNSVFNNELLLADLLLDPFLLYGLVGLLSLSVC